MSEENPKEFNWNDRSRFLPTPQQLTRFVGEDKHIISVAIDAKQSKMSKAKINEILLQASGRACEQMMELASFYTIDCIADILGLPSWDSVLDGNDFFVDEVGAAIAGRNGDDEEEEEEDRNVVIEQEIHDAYHRTWCSAVEFAFDAGADRIDAGFVIIDHENGILEISSENWNSTATKFVVLANGIDGRFEGPRYGPSLALASAVAIIKEESHGGPHSARTFVLDNLGLLKRVPEVYGGRTLLQAYSDGWR